MKNNYRMAILVMVAMSMWMPAKAQVTQYGQGTGTLGSAHVFIGASAGKSSTNNTTQNTYVGYFAGRAGKIGFGNVYLGSYSGENAEGSVANTFVGSGAGKSHLNGEGNVYMGFQAGTYSSGNFNVAIGRWAGQQTKGKENSFFGNEVGLKNGLGSYNVFMGANAGHSNEVGNYNTFLGYGAGSYNVSGEKNTYLGYGSGGNENLVNATAIGASANVTASYCLVLGNNANVGIGYSAPVYQLQLSKQAAAKAGSSTWTIMSDLRLKRNITDFTDGLDLLKQIRPVKFQYNGQGGIETGDKQFVGIIAQEMQKVAPYTVGTFIHQDSSGNKTEYLDYDANAVTYILINSVKEQQRVIEQKDAELKGMNEQMAALSRRLEQLERIVASNTAKPLIGNVARTEPNANGVVLEQNVPNGFSGSSAIRYFIPESVKEAVVHVYSVNGVKVHSYPVKGRGDGKVTISASDFPNGVFLYDLVTDGASNGAKKMVVQK
ncbi:MAG: tail fiber domain-containing protein [Dyadobacter fermentans]